MELDYEHVINRKIAGCDVSIYFSKEYNPKIKEIVLNTLIDNYEKRVQDCIESSLMLTLQKENVKI